MDADALGLASALAMLGIYTISDMVELARTGVLDEMVVHAADHQSLEQHVTEAVSVHSSVAERKVTELLQATTQAAAAEKRLTEVEKRCAKAEAQLQVQPQHQRCGGMVNARTQTPTLMTRNVSVATQAPSCQVAAAVAKQQHESQLRLEQQMEESAHQRAQHVLLPVLERAIAAAEAADRVVSQKQASAQKCMESLRLMAERRAREAAAAAADRAAAAEERAAAAEASLVINNHYNACYNEFVVELAVLCICLSELEEENIDLQDTVIGLYEFLQNAREGPCHHCSAS
jgi:hypothetical protein